MRYNRAVRGWLVVLTVTLAGAATLAAVLLTRGRRPAASPAAAPSGAPWASADFAGDGTPDFLRLDDEADRRAFTRWFTFLAEAQFFARPEDLPREIGDCAALVRFAYREALREHDGAWASALNLPAAPPGPGVRKYRYPFTPLGPRLFRIAPGPFTPLDLANGAFAEYADALTLVRRNCHFVSRDVRRANPGDLLFYRQLEHDLPNHVMIFLGPSPLDPGPADFVVYHTGPAGKTRGEIRRPSLEELQRHPEPRWRPAAGNQNFAGVFRWNILRQEL
ncbi:MAG: DUF1175 family protein [Acidobacteriota bacterium]